MNAVHERNVDVAQEMITLTLTLILIRSRDANPNPKPNSSPLKRC